ncbi:MAG TPA: PaaI family thioesterase [Rhodocyclaceae bacterium]|nr:PaaI family thioesterase [Rhodocyclaceae bacterium]
MPGDFFGLEVPFLDLIGVVAERDEAGRAIVAVELRPELMNSFRVSHGGVVMTLLDVAMAMAARTAAGHKGGMMTVDMSMSFLRPATGRIVAQGRVLRGGRSLVFCEGEAQDASGLTVAKALGTFMRRREMHDGEGN